MQQLAQPLCAQFFFHRRPTRARTAPGHTEDKRKGRCVHPLSAGQPIRCQKPRAHRSSECLGVAVRISPCGVCAYAEEWADLPVSPRAGFAAFPGVEVVGALPVWIRVHFGMSQRPTNAKKPAGQNHAGLCVGFWSRQTRRKPGRSMPLLTNGADYAIVFFCAQVFFSIALPAFTRSSSPCLLTARCRAMPAGFPAYT